jgi:hypothetical protein
MDMPADRRALFLTVMGIEGGINKTWQDAMDDAEPGAEIWIAEWELDLWDAD